MFKNAPGQLVTLLAVNTANNLPASGLDVSTLRAFVTRNGVGPTLLADDTPEEVHPTNAPGIYRWSLTQGETDGDELDFTGYVQGAGQVVLVPRMVFTRNANPVLVSPVGADVTEVETASTAGGVVKNLVVFQHSTSAFSWRVTSGGVAVDLTGDDLGFVVMDEDSATPDAVVFQVDAADLDLAAGDPTGAPSVFDTVVVTVRKENVAALLGKYSYRLWNLSRELVHGAGAFLVKRAPLPA